MRKRRAEKKYLKPDPKFNDILVSKFVNCVMYDGKKAVARNVIYDAFQLIEQKTSKPFLKLQPYILIRNQKLLDRASNIIK